MTFMLLWQGYGAVTPSKGLAALHAVLSAVQPIPIVAINPFTWDLFLTGACLSTHRAPTTCSWHTGF